MFSGLKLRLSGSPVMRIHYGRFLVLLQICDWSLVFMDLELSSSSVKERVEKWKAKSEVGGGDDDDSYAVTQETGVIISFHTLFSRRRFILNPLPFHIHSEMTPSFNARPKQSKATRPPPLELPSAVAHRPPQRRDVASRYLEPTSSSSSSLLQSSPYSTAKRCESPNVTRTNRPATPSSSVATNRPQSTGRRQPVTLSRGGGGAAERMLLTSGRSLFASFQANENISKLYPSPPPKSNLSDQWPRSSLQPNCLSRSVDFTETLKKPKGSCNSVARALHNSSNSMIPRKIFEQIPPR
ncbi:hypothetical protein YC2023_074733 [Brassica napus]